ncbi:MAG: ABC transporter ATP-binding protein [Clostridia bacterium]|nr:ABC transporter ATP-binding protein [Clostridia bacterium]MDE7328631.1 ABC transporter ATP-binding protein [Clostridia bacterium]
MDDILTITNLSKKYKGNDKYAVQDLCLEVKAGELVAFLGPNGAGKSTTIKCITGALPYSAGNISICGFDLHDNPISAKKNMGYVPDNHFLYETMTANEYINFMADIYGVGLNDRKQRAEKYLSLFELTDVANKQVGGYSHGMKQKICIIGALIHEPKLWILDEPLTGLDPKSAYNLKMLMKEHCKQGNSVLFSSHIIEVVEKLCDKVAIIDKGKLIVSGSMEEIKSSNTDNSLEEFFMSVTNGSEVDGGEKFDERFSSGEFD